MTISIVDPWSTQFIEELIEVFEPDLRGILQARAERRADPRGVVAAVLEMLTPETVSDPDWRVSPPPADLEDRRVEITGPAVDPKMAVTAASSGASGYMVDGEDSLCPTWANVIRTQENLWGLVRGRLRVEANGAVLALPDRRPTLHYRPRGLHMVERRWVVGREVPACLVDAGLYIYHNAATLLSNGSGPYLYLPKLETEHEARFWNRVVRWMEERLGLPDHCIKFTVLIETLPALLRVEQILWSIRQRVVGLNVGRWDYIFSAIKTIPPDSSVVYPDRRCITMDAPALAEYARWVVTVAHRRGCHAIGGMAAQVPSRRDPVAACVALDAVRRDKLREVGLGHDGTWVAHPDLVGVAMEAFSSGLGDRLHQKHVVPPGGGLDLGVLLGPIFGNVSGDGVVDAVRSALIYMNAWLGGNGCVAIDGKMEDAATAEISRALLWHWVDRGLLTRDGVESVVRGEEAALVAAGTEPRPEAASLLLDMLWSSSLPEFITVPAYDIIINNLADPRD